MSKAVIDTHLTGPERTTCMGELGEADRTEMYRLV